jgi:hypothetical protein
MLFNIFKEDRNCTLSTLPQNYPFFCSLFNHPSKQIPLKKHNPSTIDGLSHDWRLEGTLAGASSKYVGNDPELLKSMQVELDELCV